MVSPDTCCAFRGYCSTCFRYSSGSHCTAQEGPDISLSSIATVQLNNFLFFLLHSFARNLERCYDNLVSNVSEGDT